MAHDVTHISVRAEDFDIAAEVLRASAENPDATGAIVTFTGTVRGKVGARKLVSMTLEHYPGMTEAELARVASEARARWPLQAVTVIHRVGELKPGENIVLVVVASAHRHAAFDGASFIMDYLKTRAPFWKKETFSDGSSYWVDAREADTSAADRWATTR